MNNKKTKIWVIILILVFFTGCSPKNTPDSIELNGSTAYPPYLPTSNVKTAYPLDSQTNEAISYPITTPTRNPNSGPNFKISEPVVAGGVQVSGTGPANVPIILIDVTEMGLVIGETVIDSNGNFIFELSDPLIQSHAVGLQIGDLSRTDFNYDDFLYGENYTDRPLIGIILDMVSIVQE